MLVVPVCHETRSRGMLYTTAARSAWSSCSGGPAVTEISRPGHSVSKLAGNGAPLVGTKAGSVSLQPSVRSKKET